MSGEENDNPFFFELEVDDEISFKAPPQPKAPAMKVSTFTKTFLKSPGLSERNPNISSPLSDCETPVKTGSQKVFHHTPSTIPKTAIGQNVLKSRLASPLSCSEGVRNISRSPEVHMEECASESIASSNDDNISIVDQHNRDLCDAAETVLAPPAQETSANYAAGGVTADDEECESLASLLNLDGHSSPTSRVTTSESFEDVGSLDVTTPENEVLPITFAVRVAATASEEEAEARSMDNIVPSEVTSSIEVANDAEETVALVDSLQATQSVVEAVVDCGSTVETVEENEDTVYVSAAAEVSSSTIIPDEIATVSLVDDSAVITEATQPDVKTAELLPPSKPSDSVLSNSSLAFLESTFSGADDLIGTDNLLVDSSEEQTAHAAASIIGQSDWSSCNLLVSPAKAAEISSTPVEIEISNSPFSSPVRIPTTLNEKLSPAATETEEEKAETEKEEERVKEEDEREEEEEARSDDQRIDSVTITEPNVTSAMDSMEKEGEVNQAVTVCETVAEAEVAFTPASCELPVPAPVATIAPLSLPPAAADVEVSAISAETTKPRLSLGLEMKYDYAEGAHYAKYSQSELEEAVAAAVAKAELVAIAKEKEMQSREEALQARIEKAEQALLEQAEAFKQRLADAKAAQDDAELQRTQTRALAHRMQSVEAEMTALRASKAADISALTAQHNDAMLTQRQMLEAAHASEMQQVNQKLTAAEEALRVQLRESLAREEAHHNDLVVAVNAAKEKVYAKAKVQFEAGNKEFQRVKGLLKDAQALADSKQKQIDALNDQIAETKRAVEKEQARAAAAEKRSSELKTMLTGLMQCIATTATAAAAATGFPAPPAFVAPVDDLVAEQTAVATAKDSVGRLKQDLSEVLRSKESLQSATSVLQNSLQQKESQLAAINATVQQEKDRAVVAEALLAAVKVELTDTIRERDNQMTAVAKLSAALAGAEGSLVVTEEALQAAKKECADLTERCQNLRQMNEELLGMLEGMYANQQQPQGSA